MVSKKEQLYIQTKSIVIKLLYSTEQMTNGCFIVRLLKEVATLYAFYMKLEFFTCHRTSGTSNYHCITLRMFIIFRADYVHNFWENLFAIFHDPVIMATDSAPELFSIVLESKNLEISHEVLCTELACKLRSLHNHNNMPLHTSLYPPNTPLYKYSQESRLLHVCLAAAHAMLASILFQECLKCQTTFSLTVLVIHLHSWPQLFFIYHYVLIQGISTKPTPNF